MTKKLAYMSVFVAFAMILSYVEVIIPINFGIPGMKLGLPNFLSFWRCILLNERSLNNNIVR
jgi:heptaprenyl diphosphate synthase